MKYAFVVLCLAGSALANQPFFESCPSYKTMDNFNTTKFGGRWWEAVRMRETGPSCWSMSYDFRKDGTLTVNIEEESPGKDPGTTMTTQANGEGRMSDNGDKLIIRYSGEHSGFEHHVQVLGSDYESFAVVYDCIHYAGISTGHTQILARNRSRSVDVITDAIKVLESNGIKGTDLL